VRIAVDNNTPRLLTPGDAPPAEEPPPPGTPLPPPPPTFWTPDRVAQGMARAFQMLGDYYQDPRLNASDFELDIVGEVWAPVCQDLLPNIGGTAANTLSTPAKIVVALLVVAAMVLFRLPVILQHIRTDRQKALEAQQQRAAQGPAPAAASPNVVHAAFQDGPVGSGQLGRT
jgi:hypothetical protein